MNLDILSHFYTVYYKSDTAEWHSYFCAVIIRGHVLDWSGAEYGISFHFFDVFLCELLHDIPFFPSVSCCFLLFYRLTSYQTLITHRRSHLCCQLVFHLYCWMVLLGLRYEFYSLYTSASKSDIYLCKNGILSFV